jgi:hypothetical protein
MPLPSHLTLAMGVFSICVGTAAATPYTSFFGTPDTRYTTTFHLNDGRWVVCAVNEPSPGLPANARALSTSERIEAEIDATDRLRRRRHVGNKSDYPSPRTAPQVHCASAP